MATRHSADRPSSSTRSPVRRASKRANQTNVVAEPPPSFRVPWAAEALALCLLSSAIVLIQKLLFPLEQYWLALVLGLLFYTAAEWWLGRKRLTTNIFLALDQGDLRLADALVLPLGSLFIFGALRLAGWSESWFAATAVLLACTLQTALAATLRQPPRILPPSNSHSASTKAWRFSVGIVTLMYAAAFFSLPTWKPSHPQLSGAREARGIWFYIPVQASEFFPAGYARLEDSVFDDLGRVFMGGLGQSLGLVQACETPGPRLARGMPSASPSSELQPKFYYAAETMCREWVATLPGFFWRIGLLGLWLLALIISLHGLHDPMHFGMVGSAFLVMWFTWPAADNFRMGNVAMLVAGRASGDDRLLGFARSTVRAPRPLGRAGRAAIWTGGVRPATRRPGPGDSVVGRLDPGRHPAAQAGAGRNGCACPHTGLQCAGCCHQWDVCLSGLPAEHLRSAALAALSPLRFRAAGGHRWQRPGHCLRFHATVRQRLGHGLPRHGHLVRGLRPQSDDRLCQRLFRPHAGHGRPDLPRIPPAASRRVCAESTFEDARNRRPRRQRAQRAGILWRWCSSSDQRSNMGCGNGRGHPTRPPPQHGWASKLHSFSWVSSWPHPPF